MTPATVAAEARSMIGRGIPRRARLMMKNPQIRAHSKSMDYQQMQVAASVGLSVKDLTYSYKYAMNGFAAMLAPWQVRKLRRHAAVASVVESRQLQKMTTDSPKFLNMDSGIWGLSDTGPSITGDNMVIGMIDSGIWPEHPSFDDTDFDSTRPAGWSGTCGATKEFKCNDKIIGARVFYQGAVKAYGNPDFSADWDSPRDSDGHGTWCAGVAAGNMDVSLAGGKASGMAPTARLAIYKVAWMYNNKLTTVLDDVLAAVDQAIKDGVDVISLTLGGTNPSETYFDDLPYLFANIAGVVTVAAAGNSGSPSLRNTDTKFRTISNFSPFYLTVGAR
ncbi:unnamed protein product [Closterium sp. Naga37s-1]|nr:unnamed protein product [Closterium sp. Naga37s-1]